MNNTLSTPLKPKRRSLIRKKMDKVKRRSSFTTNISKSAPTSPRRKSDGMFKTKTNISRKPKRFSRNSFSVSPHRRYSSASKDQLKSVPVITGRKKSLSISSPDLLCSNTIKISNKQSPKLNSTAENAEKKIESLNNTFQWKSIKCIFSDNTFYMFNQVMFDSSKDSKFIKTFGRRFLKNDKKVSLQQFIFTDVFTKTFRACDALSCKLVITNRSKNSKLSFNIRLSVTGEVINPMPCLYFLVIPSNYSKNTRKFKIGIAIDKLSLGYVSFEEFKAVKFKERRENTMIFCMMKNCDQSGSSDTACSCKCKCAMYCKPEHRKKDWDLRHKFECKKI